ncbi:hypothetical protein DW020_11575 [Clostridium sp. AF37-5AT]|nr:hypothetical protein DW260_02740 [Clostridium sp. AM22-16AC]RHO38812.1 hypothetical protein DW181_06800 [Clostridium sp. AM16-23]RHO94362.1 hypothetical protein DW020_11575 [Clostridium sp. AF37-5AT]
MLLWCSDLGRRKEDFWVHVDLFGSLPLGNAGNKKVGKIIKKYLQGKLTYDIVKKLILCTSADSASGA